MPKDEESAWTLIEIAVGDDLVESVSDYLWSIGVSGVEELHSDTGPILRTSVGNHPEAVIDHLHHSFVDVTARIVTVDRAIADTWRVHAQATHVHKDIWLVPAWLPAPDNGRALFIEPLDTFGLGNHPTTVLTLKLALQLINPGAHILDVGSGSGVLSVAVAKFCDAHAEAYDIAASGQEALTINAKANGVSTVRWLDSIDNCAPEYDAVLANILAPVLRDLSQKIQELTKRSGVVVLSGMRDEQVDNTLRYFTQCEEIDRESMDGWSAVALRRH
jgi:ribosomal protein L11 methyltransferase